MSPTSTLADLKFDAPGPGSWTIDAVHQPRPWTRFQTEIWPEHFARGSRESTHRYGLLLDYNECRFVNGFAYLTPRLVPPSDVPGRLHTVSTVFERKQWREDMRLWEDQVKPAAIHSNLTLQAIDPAALSIEALLAHLDRCREHLKEMIYQHMRFTVPAGLPVGDFLVHATEWTGSQPAELLGLMRGSAPIAAGASDEIDDLVAAIRRDPSAQAVLSPEDNASGTLSALCAQPGPVGAAATAYLNLVGFRLLDGLDVGDPYALELPEVLVRTIRSVVATDRAVVTEASAELLATTRELVPIADRETFDILLAEARHTYRLRDERGVFTTVWACGITRRTILAAGRRLADEGRIEQPLHLVEAGYEEMRSLIQHDHGPSAAELADRAKYRASHTAADAPKRLGPELAGSPPFDKLPREAVRALRAIQAFAGALFGDSEAPHGPRRVRGLPASPGVYEGSARLVTDLAQLGLLKQGDVLVTHSTGEAFNIVLPLLGAIVTDSGGLLSHAAIVAREYGIPGVVGTREATRLIPDGARVRIDGHAGEVTVLS